MVPPCGSDRGHPVASAGLDCGVMRFGHLELAVRDARASLAFYTGKLGFRLVADQGPFVWVERGGLEILLRPGEVACGHDVVFYCDDPAAAAAGLRERGVAVERRGNCFHFHDPDGHAFQLVDPSEDHSGS